MKKIVLATSNKGKICEIQQALENMPVEFQLQSELSISEIEETGLTFVENALLKARHASKISGKPALADDSGLIIDALAGRPGIYSARYAGIGAASKQNIHKVLEELRAVPRAERTARFYGVIVYLEHESDPRPLICEGTWEGFILDEPETEGGFGYDPIFYISSHHCSAAKLPLEEKNRISHRGQALQDLKVKWGSYFSHVNQ
jgi:XTP/dITP diphosphohydrolase